MNNSAVKFAFFGSSRFSTLVLDELEKAGFVPACVVTTPNKPKGRRLILTPTEVKSWAQKRNIKVFDPEKLDDLFRDELAKESCEISIVASYGKIIPDAIINLPKHKTLNAHPSLLPKYRGASPIQSAMLDDAKETGVTVMMIDGKMDHGPIVAQEGVTIDEWPIYEEFEETMARVSGKLLARILPGWVAGKLEGREQDHSAAIYTKKIAKEDGLVDFKDDPYLNFRKIQAYHEWPQAYFTMDRNGKKIRIKITGASFKDGKLTIEKVVPEGSKEMTWDDFERGYRFTAADNRLS